MPINFNPNDPDGTGLPMRAISPRPNRPETRAGFTLSGEHLEDLYDFATQTEKFLFWQCREAALAALDAWEDVSGDGFNSWQGSSGPAKKIELRPDAGEDLNAFYDRVSLSFFHRTIGDRKFHSGASTDVVAHEAGHAILDAIRPGLWDSTGFEVNAFHEGFGDCVAILTALLDGPMRVAVLPLLTDRNFVESTAENLAAGIKLLAPNHNASVPRHALNHFRWKLPETLPDINSAEDGPGRLISESHSFGQVFSGCFYDTIVNIFRANGGGSEEHLLAATRTAGRLLARAVATAPENVRFFREVGRAMVKADIEDNAGANSDAIKAAFAGHDLPLGTGAMLAPIATLAGAAPTIKSTVASFGPAATDDLLARIGAVGGRLAMAPLRLGGETVVEMVHERVVPLDRLNPKLQGVVAKASETVLVGGSNGRAIVLGALPEPRTTADEVETFVRSLLHQDAIDFGGKKAVPGLAPAPVHPTTHEIRLVDGQKVLTRIRFLCHCCSPVRQG